MDNKMKVLIVEDVKIAQIAARLVLEQIGDFTIDIAGDGMQALQLASQTKYDLIFMDIGLPDMNGFETTEKIRALKHYKDIPIVALTAHDEESYRKQAVVSGMNDFLEKPLTLEKASLIFEQLCSLP